MNYIDLFHGIGGFAVGAYWAEMKFENHYCSDIEPYLVELYKKRFPDSIQLGDIREIDCEKLMANTDNGRKKSSVQTGRNESAKGSRAEWIITGGFPCQDISVAGKGTGIRGQRSGLWFEMWRIIRDLRPQFAIVENVGALTFQGLTDVLGSLAEIGYDAEWQDIRAEDMGAPHRRERIWIVAYPNGERKSQSERNEQKERRRIVNGGKELSNSLSLNDDNGRYGTGEVCRQRSEQANLSGSEKISDTMPKRLSNGNAGKDRQGPHFESTGEIGRRSRLSWSIEPSVGRLADGISGRVDRLKGLGNAIVPQIAELLFRQIKELFDTEKKL